MQIITAVVRAFQLLFAIIVLGLSVALAKGQSVGSAPAITGYAAFTGGLGIVASLVGVAAFFISSLDGLISWAVDGLASLVFLAGGIAYAVILKDADCSDVSTTWDNQILSGGCVKVDGDKTCSFGGEDKLKSRCTSAKANTAFMLIDFVI
ncbi:hypothetical protein P170DRAFT_465849 [Aspergillus steynii IBT 23096]|uniref:MARVEL domain-containing protein n=1 Tax=Aspergillus steynii IBT 23096 TaxID=1392250 RepID=A0A2I2G6N1_9EURO|nr:uncharacterized protein P170DRAFT_465849 [Aspergillus steynii IBT 23096]PLB48535.1 hypothetical protein P170DRAFT_465849 [Aspergillus steynii IBT 23096]